MKRIATAAVLIPLVTYVAVWAPDWLLLAVIAAVATLCFWEYNSLVVAYGLDRPGLLGWVAGMLILSAPGADVLRVTLVALAALARMLAASDLRKGLPGAASLLLGVFYAFAPWRSAVGLRAVSPYWLLLALSLSWVGDSAAFYVGRALGRHKLAPRLSPGKSWEGSVASLVASVAFAYFYAGWLIPQTSPLARIVIAAAGNIAGQAGDLVESLMKRGAGVKDSGTLLPGHGGWLDRVDSTLFALPVIHFLVGLFRPGF